MPKRTWEKAESGFLSDTAGLIALTLIALSRGFSYLPGQVNVGRSPAHALEGLLPPPAWAAVWLVIGLVCIVSLRWRSLMPAAVAACVLLNLVWLMSFLGLQITGENYRAYVTSINYFAAAFFIAWGFGRGKKNVITISKE
ncbi:hypothetical protein ACTXJY_00140 [Corynebacterium casei]|uniref:hypothetical protein n=1 Tax=Corynebacterium casei TaxID=160386 RepID=UPI003FCEE90C